MMDQLNSTQVSTNQSDFSSVFINQVLPSFYCIVFVVGLPLNGMAAWVFFRVPGDSGLVVYLKNMVVADLLMVFTLPFKVVHDLGLGSWYIHVITCRYIEVLFYSSMYTGIVAIGVISLERYAKVVHHSSSSTTSSRFMFGVVVSSLHLLQSARVARVVAFFAWGLFLLFFLPNIVLTIQPADEDRFQSCTAMVTPLGMQWRKACVFFSMSVFWLTLFVLAFCYASIAKHVHRSCQRVRSDNSDVRRKSNRSIFSIFAVFFFCFVPFHVCQVLYILSQIPALGFSENARVLLYQLKEGTVFLSTLNVCLDPVVYFLMCRTFRASLIRKLSARKKKRSLSNIHSLNNICNERTDETQEK